MGFEVNDFIDLPFSRASRWLVFFCQSALRVCFWFGGRGMGVDGLYGFEHLEKGTNGWFRVFWGDEILG